MCVLARRSFRDAAPPALPARPPWQPRLGFWQDEPRSATDTADTSAIEQAPGISAGAYDVGGRDFAAASSSRYSRAYCSWR